mmetsp:Transcript_904/g.3540  ORF Transcript_904/g.3540 Transcript_904/m.3540 type:complete len:356 (+) Transcript_904:4616-5683(+)
MVTLTATARSSMRWRPTRAWPPCSRRTARTRARTRPEALSSSRPPSMGRRRVKARTRATRRGATRMRARTTAMMTRATTIWRRWRRTAPPPAARSAHAWRRWRPLTSTWAAATVTATTTATPMMPGRRAPGSLPRTRPSAAAAAARRRRLPPRRPSCAALRPRAWRAPRAPRAPKTSSGCCWLLRAAPTLGSSTWRCTSQRVTRLLRARWPGARSMPSPGATRPTSWQYGPPGSTWRTCTASPTPKRRPRRSLPRRALARTPRSCTWCCSTSTSARLTTAPQPPTSSCRACAAASRRAARFGCALSSTSCARARAQKLAPRSTARCSRCRAASTSRPSPRPRCSSSATARPSARA